MEHFSQPAFGIDMYTAEFGMKRHQPCRPCLIAGRSPRWSPRACEPAANLGSETTVSKPSAKPQGWFRPHRYLARRNSRYQHSQPKPFAIKEIRDDNDT